MINNDLTVSAPDETQIAYSVTGRGPALMLTNGLTTSSFFWKYLQPRWRDHYTVITWDLPGHGRSGPAKSAAAATIEGQPSIMESVLAAAGVESAVQIGWSVGCQIVLELYRQRPQRCRALVTLFGPAEHALSNTALPVPGRWIHSLLNHGQGAACAALIQNLAQLAALPGGPGLGRQLGLLGADAKSADVRHLLSDLRNVHSATGQRMAISAQAHSAFDVLALLRVPLLIMAGDRDPFAPPERVALPMHRSARGSELLRLPKATHTALLDHADVIGDGVEDFLARRLRASN